MSNPKNLQPMTPERHAKGLATRKKSKAILKRWGFPLTMAKAIRLKCLDCMPESPTWVATCDQTDCPLWPYRMGRPPQEKDMKVALFSREGKVIGYRELGEGTRPGQP